MERQRWIKVRGWDNDWVVVQPGITFLKESGLKVVETSTKKSSLGIVERPVSLGYCHTEKVWRLDGWLPNEEAEATLWSKIVATHRTRAWSDFEILALRYKELFDAPGEHIHTDNRIDGYLHDTPAIPRGALGVTLKYAIGAGPGQRYGAGADKSTTWVSRKSFPTSAS